MSRLIIIILLNLTYTSIDAQVCFTYDNAGNRTKREACVVAITNQEMDDLIRINSDLTSELRTISNTEDLSELVIYPNPTSAAIQLKNQMEWLGATLKIVTNDGKVLNTVNITDGPIDMSHLPSGTYFLILSNNTSRKTAKLFITK